MRLIEDKFEIQSKIYFRKEAMLLLKEINGTKAFIVSDGTMEKLGYLQKAQDYLKEAGIPSVAFTEIHPDPDVKIIAKGLTGYQECDADILVALGGGSAIDAAKGILYAAWQLKAAEGQSFQKPLFIAIPSTSGTGSEVTNFSVITAEGEKICIVDSFIAPDMAILDSTCIQHVPKRVVADTGIDVLVHAIEAYVSLKATDFTDALAEKAIKTIFTYLEKVYKNPEDAYARDRVLNASCMAGMAFTNANLGINHSLAHALGGRFHIPHGRANALLLDVVIAYNSNIAGKIDDTVCERYAELARILNLPARTNREGTVSFMQAVKTLKKSLEVEEGIGALNIEKADYLEALDQMAETALQDRCMPTNPRQPTKEELIKIYEQAF